MVLFHASKVEFRSRSQLPYLGDEQFWGRAVRASCGPLDPGRFLFVGKFRSGSHVPTNSRFSSARLVGEGRYLFIFPEDRLR
jgi:hypothetical protein